VGKWFPKPWVGGSNPSKPTILNDLVSHRTTVFRLIQNRRILGLRNFLLANTKDLALKIGALSAEVHSRVWTLGKDERFRPMVMQIRSGIEAVRLGPRTDLEHGAVNGSSRYTEG
jgi:hypothetical protein